MTHVVHFRDFATGRFIPYEDTRTRCETCKGVGKLRRADGLRIKSNRPALSWNETCDDCGGFGYVAVQWGRHVVAD